MTDDSCESYLCNFFLLITRKGACKVQYMINSIYTMKLTTTVYNTFIIINNTLYIIL